MKAKIKKILLLILTVLTATFIGVFAVACGEELGTLKSNKITYDGKTITWSKVKGAKEYVVSIDGGTPKTVDEPKLLFSAGKRDSVEVSIQPIGKEEEGKTVSRTFTRLETIETSAVTFSEEGVMSWEEVEGADEYILSIGGTEVTVSALEYSEFTYDGKSTQIKIRPSCSDGSTYSTFSSSMTKTFLAEIDPATISYDGEMLKWRGAGSNYKVFIDGAEMLTVNSTQYVFDAEESDFFVQVQTIGDGVNSFSSPLAEAKEFVFLPIITDAAVVDGNLTWSEVEHADRYSIVINDTPYLTEKTTYELPAGADLSIKVKAVLDEGDVYFSAYSDEISAYILKAPEIKWNNSYPLVDGKDAEAVSWNPVQGNVDGYQIKLELPTGEQPNLDPLGKDDYAFPYAFLDVGTYKVSVQATGDASEDVYSSKYSQEITVVRLPAPDQAAQGFITSDPTNNSTFKLTWKSVSGAKEYQIWKDGVAVPGLTTTNYYKDITNIVNANISSEEKITYGIQSIGAISHNSDGTTRVVLSSLIEKNLPAEITVLAMPTDVNIAEGSTELTWTGVPSANGYAVKGVGSTVPASVTTESYGMENLSRGDHSLQVCAKGNGGATLASNYTAITPVCRLSAPENIRIGTEDSNEGSWLWTPVQTQSGYVANGYILSVKGQTETKEVNINDKVNDLITTSGTTISVAANANEWVSGVYYITSAFSDSKTFTKLQTPTFSSPIIRDRSLVWNAPTNIKGSFTVSYNVYKTTTSLYMNVQNTPQMPLNQGTFQAGTHTFLVKAIGDGESYINSDISEQKEVLILDTPTVTRGETAYEWDGVALATGYNVTIGENIEEIKLDSSEKYSFDPVKYLTTVNSTYNVQITAKGYNNNTEDVNGLTVIDSWPRTIVQSVKRLNTPTISFEYQVDGEKATQYDENGEIVVKISSAIANASGYSYTIGDSTQSSEEMSYGLCPHSTGTFKMSAFAIGGTFDSAGNYYINSESTSSKVITLLSSPDAQNIYTQGNALRWTTISGASYYEIILTYKDGKTKTDKTTSNTGLLSVSDISNLSSVKICAKGNGSTTIDSAYVEQILG